MMIQTLVIGVYVPTYVARLGKHDHSHNNLMLNPGEGRERR